MATSGSVYTGKWYAESGNYWRVVLYWSSKQDIATNTSTITWNAYVDSSSTGYVWINEISVWIGNSRVWYHGESNYKKGYDGTYLCGGTKTITHNDDGSADLYVYIGAGIYVWDVNHYNSATYTLPTIPRKATIISAPSFTDTENPTITYENLAGDAITSIEACISSDGTKIEVPYRPLTLDGTSYTFNLTDDERNALIDATTGSASRTVYFYIKSVLADNTYYDNVAKTFTVVDGAPLLNPVAEVGTDTKTYSLTGSQYKFIKGYTNVSVATGAVAQKRATIASHTIINGSTVNSNALNAASGTLKATDTLYTFRATDSRGQSTTATLTRELVDYITLTVSAEVPNPDADGDLTMKVSGNYFKGSFGVADNTLTIKYRYKVDGVWTDYITATGTPSYSGNTYSLDIAVSGLDYRKAYTFQVQAIDKLFTKTTGEYTVRTIPVFDWGEEDFNLNAKLNMNGETILRHNTTANNVVLSATGGFIYFRPAGTNDTSNEIKFNPQGSIELSGDIIIDGQSLKSILTNAGLL